MTFTSLQLVLRFLLSQPGELGEGRKKVKLPPSPVRKQIISVPAVLLLVPQMVFVKNVVVDVVVAEAVIPVPVLLSVFVILIMFGDGLGQKTSAGLVLVVKIQ